MKMNKLKLNKTLFWDTPLNQIDPEKHADFIIQRVLEYGDQKDWQIIKKYYPLKQIKHATINSKNLSQKSANFWSLILSIPKNKFLCFKKHSLQKQDPFLQRSAN
jgi:hypothetical protein